MTAGLTTTCGSRMLANFTAPYDAHVVAGLRQAGTVLLGKTNMDEFAMGSSQRDLVFRRGEESVEPGLRARRQLGRLGGGGGRAAGARRHRHRHRRLDPAAGGADRHHRPQAHLRHLLALRADRVRVEPRPGGPVRAHRRGLRAAALGDGRPRRARLDRRSSARSRTTRAGCASPLPTRHGRSPACASACPTSTSPAALDAEVARADRRRARRVPRARRDDGGGRLPQRQALGAGLLRDRAGGGVVEPVALRRRALRPPRREVRRPRRHVPEDPRRGLRRRGQAAHPGRHLRALARLLRRLLPEGAAGAAADRRRLPARVPSSAT